MRIEVPNPNMGFRGDGTDAYKHFAAYLDGELVPNAILADEEAGVVYALLSADGVWEVRKGRVELKLCA